MLNAKRLFTMVVALGLGACVTRGEIEELKQNDQKILAKLDALSKGGMAAGPQRQAPRGPDPAKTYAFPLEDSPIKGAADAWVTVIEISDFQCPFCKRVGPTLKEIEQKYGSDVRFTFKHNPLPFHNRATPAAMAAACANEQGKFWKMHDTLFENQQALEDADLEKYAREVGVDVAKWKTCVTGQKYKDRIAQDMAKSAQLGARGTPAFFINGRFLSGAQPTAAFTALIDEELKKAKESGIAKRDYYGKQVVEKGEKAAAL